VEQRVSRGLENIPLLVETLPVLSAPSFAAMLKSFSSLLTTDSRYQPVGTEEHIENPISSKDDHNTNVLLLYPHDLNDKDDNDYNEDGIHYSHIRKDPVKDGKGATFASCYFTLANTIMGSGMLGLPYAFSRTGWVLGTLLIMISATSSSLALHFLSCCALKLPYPSSFYTVASTAIPNFEKLIDIAVILKCFGVATSYLIVIGGLMPDVIDEMYGSSTNASKSFWKSRLTWVTIGFMIITPISFFRQLKALRYTSFLSICFIIFLMFLIVLYSADIDGLDPCATDDGTDDKEVCVGEKVNFKFDVETMKVFSIFIFGFTCHQNMFTIVNEIRPVSRPRLNGVIMAAIGTAFTIYMIVATSGYNTFGYEVESNILKSYPSKLFC
jgi:amino acid permease